MRKSLPEDAETNIADYRGQIAELKPHDANDGNTT